MLTTDNSNVTLAEADAYHEDRLTPGWADRTDDERCAALIRATDYIAFTYTLGAGVDRTNPLVKQATMVLAPAALDATLTETVTANVTSEELEGVVKVEYADRPVFDPYPHITRMLAPVASSSKGGFRSAKAIL